MVYLDAPYTQKGDTRIHHWSYASELFFGIVIFVTFSAIFRLSSYFEPVAAGGGNWNITENHC